MRRPEYKEWFTFGNLVTILSVVGSALAFFLSYHDQLRAAQSEIHILRTIVTQREMREQEFKRELLQRVADLQTDIREIRSAIGVSGRERK